jgi:U32 family peptidase
LIELLAPAGGFDQLKAALRFGADAVYTGIDRYGLRAYADNFTLDSLPEAVDYAHHAGKRIYLTLNILPFDGDMPGIIKSAVRAREIGIDAVIVSDIGAILALRRDIPGLAIHVSTQANVLNSMAAGFFQSIGVSRVILSRELSLPQIHVMRQNLTAAIELEGFVHGAVCMAYSGRCLMSNYLTGRSSNHGECSQPCRWAFAVDNGRNPDMSLPVFQDSRGSYIFSASDLNMIGHLPEMIAAGITSFKIEGRMKTEYYVATVTRAYRKALDLLFDNEKEYLTAVPELQQELSKASHRISNTGFYFGMPHPSSGAEGCVQDMEYIAKAEGMVGCDALLTVKNRFFVGDNLEVLSPDGIHGWKVESIKLLDTGETVPFVTIAETKVLVPADFLVMAGDLVRGINRNHRGTSRG